MRSPFVVLVLGLAFGSGQAATVRCGPEQARLAYAALVERANERLVAAHTPPTLLKEQRGHVRVARSSASALGPLADPDRQAALGEALARLGQRLQSKPATVCGEVLRLREAYRLGD